MIYCDNSATTLKKPSAVAEAVGSAINTFGNAGRSFYDAALIPGREIFKTRLEIAKLIGLSEPLNVAFTCSATESLNLVVGGLVGKEDCVVTTVAEHNSVLRPLYLSGCDLKFADCDGNGNFAVEEFEKLLKPPVKLLVCTHGSNVTGNVNDVDRLYKLCKANGITMILDISQTFGAIPVSVNTADIFCFTGHKSLFGPQGTGGIIVNGKYGGEIVKTGGAGVNSFERIQSTEMPDIFEVGTQNGHSIYGLQQGVKFINETGIKKIHAKEMLLTKMFYDGVKNIEGVKIYGDFSNGIKNGGQAGVYGDFSAENRLPVVSLNLDGMTSSELAERLWVRYGIAVRAGTHCAPLLHKRLGTAEGGAVRFSFSHFNTESEIEQCISALEQVSKTVKR